MPATIPMRPRIAVTLGDAAGVGPELAAKLLANPDNRNRADLIVLADRCEVERAAKIANVTVPIADSASVDAVQVLDDGTAPKVPFEIGKISKESGARTLYQLKRAVELVNAGAADAILFTPLNKYALHLGGMHEEDELRWFAMHLKHEGFTSEINVIPGLWTSRVTSHVGIKDVSSRITRKGVTDAIELLHNLLSDFGTTSPRIGVCGLNPHNGENGLFGPEEIELIRPGVEDAAAKGFNASGPFPADTIFVGRKDYDGIVTQYHDQGQIALKVIGFDGGVTVQGGLPVVVATPAHGTAFDIAGKNIASVTSSQNAMDIAIKCAQQLVLRRATEGNRKKGTVHVKNGAVSTVQVSSVTA